MRSSAAAALVALVLVTPIKTHSWVEELDVIDPNTAQFKGTPGYCRNNTKRSAPGFGDPLMVHILPAANQPAIEERDIPALDTTGIQPSDTMCKRTQSTQFQSNGSPRLQASPGDLVALRYQENGHVSLPQNQPGKPANRGLVYIYGTTQPKFPELFLDVFGQWTADGQGGDKRGRLLATQPFDDGRCYQKSTSPISVSRQAQYPHTANELMGADLWCQNNIKIPTDVPTGKPYTIYWSWDWPTEAGKDPNLPLGKAEMYSTCLDLDIVAKPASKRRMKARQAPSPPAASNSPTIDLNKAAIPSYVSSLTATPAPSGASPVISAQASAVSPESGSTSPAAKAADSNSMTNAGVNSYIANEVSAAIAAQVPKTPLTVTVDVVQSVVSPLNAGAVATQPAGVSVPAVSASMAPAANQAPAATPPTASTSSPAQVSSIPPKSLQIMPPVLSASPVASNSVSPPGFSGTARPAVASPAVASPAVASPAGAPQNGTAAAKGKRECSAKNCNSKRQSRILGNKKSGGQRV